VLGPYTGGILAGAEGDYYFTARVAAAGSAVAVGISCALPGDLGRSRPHRDVALAGERAEDQDEARLPPWTQRSLMIFGLVGPLILAKLATSTATSMVASALSLILKDDFGLSETSLGMFLSCQFAFGAFANALLLAPVTRLLGGHARPVVANCVAIMAGGYFAQAVLRSEAVGLVGIMPQEVQTYAFVGVALLLSLFQYSLATVITAENTRIVPQSMKGTLIGMEHGIFSAARILTPSIGIGILNAAGSDALYAVCGGVFLLVLAAWLALPRRFLPSRAPSEASPQDAKSSSSMELRSGSRV